MLDPTTKFSTARRWGDAYEQRLLEIQALRLLTDGDVVAVYHEHRDAAPVDDIIVERTTLVEAFQAKHAASQHGLYTYEQFLGRDTTSNESYVSVAQLYQAWSRLRAKNPATKISVFTNRAADAELAKILDAEKIRIEVVQNTSPSKARFAEISTACGSLPDAELATFLAALHFDLRRPGPDGLRSLLRADFDTKLGIDDPSVVDRYIHFIEQRFYERISTAITRDQLLRALQLDKPLIPQIFPVDLRTLVERSALSRALREQIDKADAAYLAVVGPPGSGKSTFLSRFADAISAEPQFSVLRYYSYVSLLDPHQSDRATLHAFVRGLLEQVWLLHGDRIQSGRRYDYSVARLKELLAEVAASLLSDKRKLVLVLDGLDHAARASVPEHEKFIQALPVLLPSNCVCVLGTQATSFLPPQILAQLGDRALSMPLFSSSESEACFRMASGIRLGSAEERSRLHATTEGLPLYVRYVAEYAKHHRGEDLASLLRQLPAHAGHITNYYNWLWTRGLDDATTKRACALLARLRFTVSEADFSRLLDADAFASEAVMNRVRHLLTGGAMAVRIFHSSFRQFIESHLTPSQTRSVDERILEYLDASRWTGNWYAHAFEYAASARRDTLLREYVTRDYVDNAIAAGRAHTEVRDSLLLAFDRAVACNKIAFAADCARFLTDATIRLEYEFDSAQLDACIAATRQGTTAADRVLDALSRGDIPHASAPTLLRLARLGHLDSCAPVASAFIDSTLSQSRNLTLDNFAECVEVGCTYDLLRPSWILDIAEANLHRPVAGPPPGRNFIRRAIARFIEFGHQASCRAFRRLVRRNRQGSEICALATLEYAYALAEAALPGAAEATRRAIQFAREPSDRLRLASLVARFDLGKEAADKLLGTTVLPDLDSERVRHHIVSADSFADFRNYVQVLNYLGRKTEISATASRLKKAGDWLAHYYLLNLELVTLRAAQATAPEQARTHALALFDSLSSKTKAPRERIFEVFSAIRADLPLWLSAVLTCLVGAGAPVADIAAAIDRFSRSEIANTHYGFGLVVADYDVELALLEVLGRIPALQAAMPPVFDRLRRKIDEETQETGTRASHFLRLGAVAGRCGWAGIALDCLKDGVKASGGYGHRKDNTLDLLIDASEIASSNSWFDEKDWAEMASWAAAMDVITDGKGTKWLVRALFECVASARPERSLAFLRALQVTAPAWKFHDCIAIYLRRETADPLVAYLLSELIDDCDDREGFGPKASARLNILLAAERAKFPSITALATTFRGFIETAVDPKTREETSRKYNDLAGRIGARLLSVAQTTPPVPETTEHAPPEDQLLKDASGERIQPNAVDGLVGDDVAKFEAFLARTRAENVTIFYRHPIQEIARRLLKRAKVRPDVDRLVASLFHEVSMESDNLLAIAEAYESVGEIELSEAHYVRAFDAMHGWGLWDKRVEYLDKPSRRDPGRPLSLALAVIREHLERYSNAFGADLLLIRTLHRFAKQNPELTDVYIGLRDHVRARFRHLRMDLPVYTQVFEETGGPQPPFWVWGLDIIRDGWREMHEQHRTRSMLAALILVGGLDPSTWIPFVVAFACDNQTPPALRTDALYVLLAWAGTQAALLVSFAPCLRSLGERWVHFEGREILAEVFRLLRQSDETQVAPGRRIALPPGTRPTLHFRRDILDQSLRSVRELVPSLAALLDLSPDELLWRVERHLDRAGVDVNELREKDRALARSNIHPQGINYSYIPFEPTASAVLRDGLNAVAAELCAPERRREIRRLFRSRDWWTSWCPRSGPPSELLAIAPLGSSDDPAEMCALKEVPPSLAVGRELGDWIPVFDSGHIEHQGGVSYSLNRVAALGSAAHVGSAADDLSRVVHDNILRLASAEDGSYSVEEIQGLANGLTQGPHDPNGLMEAPLIAIHFGRNLLADVNTVAVLPAFWATRLRLDWERAALVLRANGEPRARTFCWEAGHAVGLYKYQSLGFGVRMHLHRRLVDALAEQYGLRLIVHTEVRCSVKHRWDESKDVEGTSVWRVDVV